MDSGETGAASRALERLARTWPEAVARRDQAGTRSLVTPLIEPAALPQALHVRGTNFQIQVWSALLHLPAGSATPRNEPADLEPTPLDTAIADLPAWSDPATPDARAAFGVGGVPARTGSS